MVQAHLPLMEKSIKYLVCGIPSRLENAFHLDYGLPIRNIKRDLNGWKHITVSWIGHINALKMNVLPRISYLFHQLPVDVPDKQFKDKYVKDACVTFCVLGCALVGKVPNCGSLDGFPQHPSNLKRDGSCDHGKVGGTTKKEMQVFSQRACRFLILYHLFL